MRIVGNKTLGDETLLPRRTDTCFYSRHKDRSSVDVAITVFTDTLKTYAIVVDAAVLASQSKPEDNEIRSCSLFNCVVCLTVLSVIRHPRCVFNNEYRCGKDV
jgi:hypothetical protein